MTSNQRVVQVYLERHDVGKLFEEIRTSQDVDVKNQDMMAMLIKEMPNEPIPYLMKMLQKIYQKKSTGTDSTFPSTTVYRSDMGLVGSAIPKKQSKDPQVVLPGSKPLVSTWSAGDGGESVVSEDLSSRHQNNKSKTYEKPWLTGAKPSKGIVKSKSASKSSGMTSWNSDGNAASTSFDDIFNENNTAGTENLTKSLPVEKRLSPRHQVSPRRNKKKDSLNWRAEGKESNKENLQPPIRPSNKRMAADEDDEDDELQVQKVNRKGKKITISPATYSRFKKQNSRKKSDEQKHKLQRLLSIEKKTESTTVEAKDDSEDENEVEVLESRADLADEGAVSKSNSGVKRSITNMTPSATANVKVGVCSRCAKMLGNAPSTVISRQKSDDESLFRPNVGVIDQSDDDDFESVSQINQSKPYRPKWPVVSDSEGEEVEDITAKLSLDSTKTSPSKSVNFKSLGDETDKSDFFTTNSPLRKKTKQLTTQMVSENESDTTYTKLRSLQQRSPTKKQAWQQQMADTGSEADVEDTLPVTSPLKSRGWVQQSDDASES